MQILVVDNKDDVEIEDQKLYRRLIGRVLYLTVTRPDITYVVQHLSQFMHCLKQSHNDVTLRIVPYIKNQLGLDIFFPADNYLNLKVFCDSVWASCLMTRRSITDTV